MKILIAEDEPISRRILQAALTDGGFEVVASHNGADALKIMQAPDAPKLAATALKASRFNLFASGPLLFGMIFPNNAPGAPLVLMLGALLLGVGFWFGPLKKSFKIKPTVD